MELIFIGLIGLVFGSFVTCASYRLPLELDVVRKPSYCPHCNTKLGFCDLFPLFSWLFSRGACRHCGAKVSARYPLTELATAALFVMAYGQFGVSWELVLLALAAVALMVMIVVDLEHYIIPDSVHVVLVPLGLAYRWVSGTFSPELLWGFGVMTALALALHYGYSALRGRCMLGFGDVKFFAVVGVWLDLALIPGFLLVAGVLGVVLGVVWRLLGRGEVFPFGPALALALWGALLFPECINVMYYIR